MGHLLAGSFPPVLRLELNKEGEDFHVPFHGLVSADVAQVHADSAWTVDGYCSPGSGPGPTRAVVGLVLLVDVPLLGVRYDVLKLGATLSGLDALSPQWDFAHTWIPGGCVLAVSAALVVWFLCAAPGLLVGRLWWRLCVWQWRSIGTLARFCSWVVLWWSKRWCR